MRGNDGMERLPKLLKILCELTDYRYEFDLTTSRIQLHLPHRGHKSFSGKRERADLDERCHNGSVSTMDRFTCYLRSYLLENIYTHT